jgi:hypothetical protein
VAGPVWLSDPLGVARGLQDQVGDLLRMRDERQMALAFTSIVVAPMRLAMNRSRSGSIVRSSVETALYVRCSSRAVSSLGMSSITSCPHASSSRHQRRSPALA